MTPVQAELIRPALKFVNKIRMAAGKAPLVQLPVGVKGEPEECPKKRALAGIGGAVRVGRWTVKVNVGTPVYAAIKQAYPFRPRFYSHQGRTCKFFLRWPERRFIKNFDNGSIPGLAGAAIRGHVPDSVDAELRAMIEREHELASV